MRFLKENWKMLIIILIIAILFPIIILKPSKYGTIPYEIGIAIVSYGGSILGGFLTLYGVWWTIKNQEDKRKQDLAIQYKPILIISFTSPFETPPKGIDPITEHKDGEILIKYKCWLKNIGTGNAEDVSIMIDTNNDENITNYDFKLPYMKHFDILVPSNNGISLVIILKVKKEKKMIRFSIYVTYKCPFEKTIKTSRFIINHLYYSCTVYAETYQPSGKQI